jgi:hypothetical protein
MALEDSEIMQGSVINTDGTCTFTLPDGHQIQRERPPVTGKDLIEWCNAIRGVASGRAKALIEEQIAKKAARKADGESAPSSSSSATATAPTDLPPNEHSVLPPVNPLDYAAAQRKQASDDVEDYGRQIAELDTKLSSAVSSFKMWAGIVKGIEASEE